MRHLLFVLLFLVLFPAAQAAQGCDGDILITIDSVSCFGCDDPSYSAKIYADGTVVYVGMGGVKEVGERRFKLSQQSIQALVKEFQRFDYWSFKDEYIADERGMRATDQGSTITSICLNGKRKQVVNVHGPQKLAELEERIESLAGLYSLLGPL